MNLKYFVRWSAGLFVALGLVVNLTRAQQGSFALLNKHIHAVQLGAGSTQIAATGAYTFEANIDGTATTPAPPNSVTLPNSGAVRSLTYVSSNQNWEYGLAFDTAAALAAAFPSGTYTYTLGGRVVGVPFTGDLYPSAPVATVSSGTWANGTLTVDRTQALTVTINFPVNYATNASRLALRVSGPGLADIAVDNSASGFNDAQLSLTVPASTLVAGTVYDVELEANRIASLNTTSVPGYTVVSLYSVTTTFRLTAAGLPVFQQQPLNQEVSNNSTVVFSASAPNANTYQWLKNNAPINGATTSRLVIFGATAADAAAYTVVATNGAGDTRSLPATLRIAQGNDFGRLSNLSILTELTATTSEFTLGMVIGGAGTTGDKPLVIRAVGPSLAQFVGAGALADPNLSVSADQTVVASNNDWAGLESLGAAFDQVGAFTYESATSKDAAVFSQFRPRDYTVRIGGAAGTQGRVLAEIYDATALTFFRPTTSRLINVSVRKQIDAGTSLTAGFVIGGSTSKTVLVRAIGPGLTPFGVPGVMADPRLELFGRGGVSLASNDNWGGDAQISAASDRVGAFRLSSATSNDAMLLVTLPPGNYTAEVRGTAGGQALVEVYEVP